MAMDDLSVTANNRRFIALDAFRVFIVTVVLLFHAVIHKFWHLSGDGFFFRNMITAAVYMDAFFILCRVLFCIIGTVEKINLFRRMLFMPKGFSNFIHRILFLPQLLCCMTEVLTGRLCLPKCCVFRVFLNRFFPNTAMTAHGSFPA